MWSYSNGVGLDNDQDDSRRSQYMNMVVDVGIFLERYVGSFV